MQRPEQSARNSMRRIMPVRLNRIACLILLSLVMLGNATLSGTAPALARMPGDFHHPVAVKLKNGLKVILLEERSFPLISCQMWYHAGSVNDPAGLSGTCHIVEHALSDSIKKDGGKLAAALVGSGGRFDAFTSDDFTVFVENLPSSELDLALTLQAARLSVKDLNEKDLEKARQDVMREIRNEKHPVEVALNREVRALCYSRHPYKNLPAGLEDELMRLTLPVASQFHKMYFRPSNATLVLSGDFEPLKALPLIQQKLGAITDSGLVESTTGAPPNTGAGASSGGSRTAREVLRQIPHEPKQLGEKRVYIKHGGERDHLLVAFRGPDSMDNDAPGVAVLEALLGDSTFGLLKEVFIDSDLCDRARAAFELRKHPGILVLSVRGKGGVNASKLLSGVDKLCDRLRDGDFDNQLQESAKARAIFSFLKHRDGPYRSGFQLGFFDSLGKLENAQRWTARLTNIKKPDIVRLASRLMINDNRSIGFLISKPDAQAKKAIASNFEDIRHSRDINNLVNLDNPDKFENAESILAAESEISFLSSISRAAYSGSYVSAGAATKNDLTSRQGGLYSISDKDKERNVISSSESSTKSEKEIQGSAVKKPEETVETKPEEHQKPGLNLSQPAGKVIKGLTAPIQVPIQAVGAGVKVIESGAAPGAGLVIKGIADSLQAVGTGVGRALDPRSGVVPLEQRLQQCDMPDGIKLIVHYVPSSSVVSVAGAIAAGSAYEAPDKRGLADLNVALMNGDSTKITHENSNAHQYQRGLSHGDLIRFLPGREHIKFKTRCLDKDLEIQLKLLSHHLLHPSMSEESLKEAKDSAAATIKAEYRNTRRKTTRLLLANLIDDESSFAPPAPQKQLKNLDDFTSAEIDKFRESTIRPQNMVLVITGNINLNSARTAVSNAFKDWTVKGSPPKALLLPSKRKVLKVALPLDGEKTVSMTIGKLVTAAANDSKLLLANCALEKHPFYARLNELKRALQPEGRIASTIVPLANSSAWILDIDASEAKSRTISAALKKSLENFSRSGLSESELLAMKKYITGHYAVSAMSNLENSSFSLLDESLNDSDPSLCLDRNKELSAVDLEGLNKFILEKFNPESSCLVVAGDKKSIRHIGQISGASPPASATGQE